MLNSCLNTTGFPTLSFWHLPSLEEFSLFSYRRYVVQIYQFSNAGVNAVLSAGRTGLIALHGFFSLLLKGWPTFYKNREPRPVGLHFNATLSFARICEIPMSSFSLDDGFFFEFKYVA